MESKQQVNKALRNVIRRCGMLKGSSSTDEICNGCNKSKEQIPHVHLQKVFHCNIRFASLRFISHPMTKKPHKCATSLTLDPTRHPLNKPGAVTAGRVFSAGVVIQRR